MVVASGPAASHSGSVSGGGFSIFQYSPYTTWNVTGLRLENSFFGSRDHGIGGMPAVVGSPCEESTRLIYISRELDAVFQAVPLSASSAIPATPWALNINQFPADICVTSTSPATARECNR